jgi:hypothetical protein
VSFIVKHQKAGSRDAKTDGVRHRTWEDALSDLLGWHKDGTAPSVWSRQDELDCWDDEFEATFGAEAVANTDGAYEHTLTDPRAGHLGWYANLEDANRALYEHAKFCDTIALWIEEVTDDDADDNFA